MCPILWAVFSRRVFHKCDVDNVYKFVTNVKTFPHEKTAQDKGKYEFYTFTQRLLLLLRF